MKKPLLQAIKDQTLLCDGAMGTELQKRGLEPGGCGELWNTEYPERIFEIHSQYVQAGAQCITTNTFGGSRIMLERHLDKPDVKNINYAAVEIAKASFGERDGYVIGDIGPFGGLLEPYGEFTEKEVRAAIQEQIRYLVEAGCDAIIIETQIVFEELLIGIEEAQKANAPCIIASMAFDLTNETKEIRTMMGADPEQAAKFIEEAGAHIIALNCGTGITMELALDVVQRYKKTCKLPVMVQPNAGNPELDGTQVVYRQTPEQMAEQAKLILKEGVAIIGSCCGSRPEHTHALHSLFPTKIPHQTEQQQQAARV